ncbi:MAG: peptidoglycan-associated lipoprotein Pal [Nitrospinae bacterium]|nr:peptidoglycan-associated lipoprotein Pal [Nitrospinota bacterium]
MITMNWKAIITTVLCIFLTTACSKKLMPPEIETSGSASEGTEFTASSSPSSTESEFGGSGGPEDSGFFSEEPILESGSSGSSSSFGTSSSSSGANGSGGSAGSGSGETGGTGGSSKDSFGSSGQANIGNGSTGSFSANPFASNNGGGGSGNIFGSGSGSNLGMGSGSAGGIQESRLQSFQATADLKDIHFEFDQYDLDSNSKAILKANAAFLKKNPNMHVEVQGHCDERGTNNYNIALGERRAHSTKKYLVSQGVDSRKVHVISYGEEKPFCFTSGEACWYQNRRAHFMVSK